MKEIDKQQKQSGMTAEELLFELDQLRIKYKGYKPDIEESSPRIDESIDLINQFKSDICKDFHKWYCVEHRYVVTSPFTTDEIVNEYLNAPEPE